MKLLLDTHVFLWWLQDNPRLPGKIKTEIKTPANTISVSAASIWEIAIKASVGKLQSSWNGRVGLADSISACEFTELPVTASHASAVRLLPFHHPDPIDRLLVVQAQLEDLVLATADAAIRRYDVRMLSASC